MKIVITGGLGFIGEHLARSLRKDQHSIYVIDRNKSSQRKYFQCNLDNSIQTHTLLDRISPEVIIHLAGSHRADNTLSTPNSYITSNVAATLNILHYTIQARYKPKIIFSSSAGALYTSGRIPYSEENEINPITSYGITKALEESLIRYYAFSHDITYQILRFSNVYGPGQERYKYPSIIPSIILSILRRKPVHIYGGGEQTRDFLYIEDAVDGFMKVLRYKKSAIFNVSTGKGTTIKKLYRLIGNKMQLKNDEYLQFAQGPVGVKNSVVGYERIYKQLKWEPRTVLSEGLHKTIDYLKSYQDV